MSVSHPDSPAGEPDADPAIDRAAALDDFLSGFTAAPADDPGMAGADGMGALVDTILLLRQVAAADGVVPTATPTPPPRSIGRHAILRLAGEGGSATVWEGFDTVLRRPVAVKVLRPQSLLSATARRRFVREAEIAARLVHPHIVTIFEVGEDGGQEFIASEYCSAGNLATWLEHRATVVEPRTAARLVRALAGAVAYAHDAGVVHRDIKPGNVLLAPVPPGLEPILPAADSRGAGMTVKLGDFGLGKVGDDVDPSNPLTQLTHTGTTLGTPAWMAPEQIDRSFGPVGPATDVHALGLLLDRLLTGRSLRGTGSEAETFRRVLLDDPPSADRIVRGVPADLAAVVSKCLAKRPADRYASAGALADDLDRWLDGRPTLARPLTRAIRGVRWIRRRPVVAGLTAATLAASLAAVWSGIAQVRVARDATHHEREARRQQAGAELRRGFEALRSGNVAGAMEQLEATRTLDPELARSLAGRWLVRRTHEEREVLLDADAAGNGDATAPRDLYAIVLGPEGITAAVAGADGSIRLLRRLDASPSITTVAAHDEVNDICFSPDGTLLASVGQEGLLRRWRMTDAGLEAAGETRPGGGPLYAVAFAPDGRSIAVGGADRVVRLMDLAATADPVELFRFEPPAGTSPDVESIVFVNAAALAASCGSRVVLLDATTGGLVRECERPVEEGSGAVFGNLTVSPDATRIMACGTDRRAHVWDVATGEILVTLPTHPGWVQGCAFSADGGQIATACRDGCVRLFDATTGTLIERFVGHRGRVWSVACEPAGTVLSAGGDGTVRRWDARRTADAQVVREVALPGAEINMVGEGPPPHAGSLRPVVALDRSGVPWRLDAVLGAAHTFTPPDFALAWSLAVDGRTGRLAVSRRRPCPVVVFPQGADPAAGIPIELPADTSAARACVCWTPTGDLVIHTVDGSLFWCPSDLRPARRSGATDGTVHAIAAAPAGPPRVATCGTRAVIHPLPRSVADRATVGATVVLPVAGETMAVAWSPDATLVAFGTPTGTVQIFDTATGAPRGTLAPHERAIEALGFAGDGRIIVAADRDCVRVSDVATLTTFDTVRPGWQVRTLVLTADGDRLVIGGHVGETPAAGTARMGVIEFPKR